MTDAKQLRRSRLQLVALVAFAILPMAASYLLYHSVEGGEPWSTTNRGQLLEPMPSAATMRLSTGEPLAGHWWLLVVASTQCSAECAHAIDQLRALQILLNKDAERVRRGVVGIPAPATDPGLSGVDDGQSVLGPGIYIVDPLENVVLRYDYDAAGKPVLDDMKKLLKVSQIG